MNNENQKDGVGSKEEGSIQECICEGEFPEHCGPECDCFHHLLTSRQLDSTCNHDPACGCGICNRIRVVEQAIDGIDARAKLVADGPAEGIATCKHCDLPIRETHMGRVRNEWEHLNGLSFCDRSSNWAWPKSSPVEPAAPVQPVERKEVVYDAWGKAGRLVSQPTPVVVPDEMLKKILGDLINGIKKWAVEEDGIPDWIEPSFVQAVMALGWSFTGGVDSKAISSVVTAQPAPLPSDDEDNFTTAARFAGISFSQGCQFHLMMQHLLGKAPAPGFLISEPAALPVGQKETTFDEFWSETVKWGHASAYSDTYHNKKALAQRAWNAAKGAK